VTLDGEDADRYTEVELEEFTITPRPAVPGAAVDQVRQNPDALWAMWDALTAALPIEDIHARLRARTEAAGADPCAALEGAGSTTPDTQAAPSDTGRIATEAERARALAAITLGTTYHG
jgi:hypothetical protein